MEDLKYIHFWKSYCSDKILQWELDHSEPASKVWFILLTEKLRRVEHEITIPQDKTTEQFIAL